MIWFTSDTHFGRANVLRFTDRPHADSAHMGRALVNAVNERVAPTDDLYILGDFSYQMTAAEAAALRREASVCGASAASASIGCSARKDGHSI